MGIEFLKSLFADEDGKEKALTFPEFESALSANDKIKLINLNDGGYVDKGKFDEKIGEITRLKDAAKAYEGVDVAALQAELAQTKIDYALKLALLKAKADDVDYLAYKLKESNEFKLDDKGGVTGLDEALTAIKTQYPQHFESEPTVKVKGVKLPDRTGPDDDEPKSLAEALQKAYETKE